MTLHEEGRKMCRKIQPKAPKRTRRDNLSPWRLQGHPTSSKRHEKEDKKRLDSYLTLSGHTDDAGAVLEQTNDGGGSAVTFQVLNHTRLGALHDCHTRVGRSQINTNDGITSRSIHFCIHSPNTGTQFVSHQTFFSPSFSTFPSTATALN